MSVIETVKPPATEQPPRSSGAGNIVARLTSIRGAARFAAAVLGAFAVFAVFILLKGANPIRAYIDMFHSTFADTDALGNIAIRATPVVLAALAVAVPARAGLINVGGEGQLVMGALGAMGTSMALGTHLTGPPALVLMCLAGAAAGAAWAALAAVLRLLVGISESVTTLLLNYIAVDLMFFLIFDKWKDRNGSGQPATRPLPKSERFPLLGDTRIHLGILVAVVAAVVIALVMRRTSWGFRLKVVGGNPEAARRAGLKVGSLVLTSMAVGGAMAGLGGVAQLAGVEFKIRQGFLVTYGYVGFLASWLARHRPMLVLLAGSVLAAIAIGGNSLQIDSKLPAAGVNVLMALTLLAVFGFGRSEASA